MENKPVFTRRVWNAHHWVDETSWIAKVGESMSDLKKECGLGHLDDLEFRSWWYEVHYERLSTDEHSL